MSSSGDDQFDEFTGSALAADPWITLDRRSETPTSPTPRPTIVEPEPPRPTIVPETPDLSAITVPHRVAPRSFAVEEPDPTPIAGISAASLRDILHGGYISDDSAPTLRTFLAADSLRNEYTVVPTAGVLRAPDAGRRGRTRRSPRR